MAGSMLTRLQILETDTDGSQSLFGVPFDHVFEVALHLVAHLLSLAMFVNVVRARSEDDFGGTLDVDALVVATVTDVLQDS